MSYAYRLMSTDAAWTGPALRVVLGIIMYVHGAQKLLGWYGGGGFDATMGFFTGPLHLPAFIALLVIIGEFFGGLALILGLLTRFCAAAIAAIMVGAVALVHWPYGLFMNWVGSQGGEGFEYHLLTLAICAGLMVAGGGRWSLDRALARRLEARADIAREHVHAA